MNTKIEPGCKALIIGARYTREIIGRTVRVLYQPSAFEPVLGLTTSYRATPWPKDMWFVEALPGDPPLPVPTAKVGTNDFTGRTPNRVMPIGEPRLMRIDGDETLESEVKQLEKMT